MCRMQKITQVNCPDEDRVEPESTPGVRSILLRATDRKDGADLFVHKLLNRRMPNGTYGGVRGRDWRECPSKVPPTRFFSPKTYPQKQPGGVSGKLSSTPKQYKVAHLLRFSGRYLFF